MFRRALIVFILSAVPATAAGPSKAEWKATVDKAVAFLKAAQKPDGSWGTAPQSMGVTGVVVTGLLQCGLSPDDEPVAKGLAYIETLVNPKAGHIAGADPRMGLQNYVTSVNVMALAAAKRDAKYKPVIGAASDFLRKLQWDDGEGKTDKDDFFGGAGYDSKSRPDLSNTQFFLDALKAAGAGQDDPALKKALVFVSRCQNLKSEFNDQPWAGKINDGSFIYSAAGGGATRAIDTPNAPLIGYGSMTYAGIKSMVYAGVSKDDPRYKAALAWVKKNYTLEQNPGMPTANATRGLYYFYHTFAKTLSVMGDDTFTDDKGAAHDWKADLFAALKSRQKPDGSWVNATDRWMEGDPNLVTGYSLLALSYVQPK